LKISAVQVIRITWFLSVGDHYNTTSSITGRVRDLERLLTLTAPALSINRKHLSGTMTRDLGPDFHRDLPPRCMRDLVPRSSRDLVPLPTALKPFLMRS
jgi:hypothetical protein